MGSSASKPAKSAASAAARRQYPKQPSSATTTTSSSTPTSQAHDAATKDKSPQGPVYHSKEKASDTKSEAIDLDARDPDFAASLRSIGPVIPNPTLSHSSTFSTPSQSISPSSSSSSSSSASTPYSPSATAPPPLSNNPALLTLSARETLDRAAQKEMESIGRTSHAGREFLDAVSIKQVVVMRDRQGVLPEVIERHMRLKPGVVGRLGRKGVVGEVR